jgi:hypothetical protein
MNDHARDCISCQQPADYITPWARGKIFFGRAEITLIACGFRPPGFAVRIHPQTNATTRLFFQRLDATASIAFSIRLW